MSIFDSFVTVHQYQLNDIPEELWEPLFMKLGEEYFDAGNAVELHQGDPLEGYSLHTKADVTLKKHSDIFLVDHAWTTQPANAKKELMENTQLLERLEQLMGIQVPDDGFDSSEDEETFGHTDATVQMVADQANVSYERAKQVLEEENHEVLNAIMRLTMSEEATESAKQLEDQIVGQMMASGAPQRKEDEEKKAKEERRQEREKVHRMGRVEAVYDHMWPYMQTYTYSVLSSDGQPEQQTAWYIQDEVGSALCHSHEPNMRCIPFIFSRGTSGMIPYSVLFPIKDIGSSELLTCDLVPKNLERAVDRDAYLFALTDRLAPTISKEEKKEAIVSAFKAYQATMGAMALPTLPQKTDDAITALKKAAQRSPKDQVLVYTHTPFVRNFLTLDKVKLTDDQASADIIWNSQDIMDWSIFKANQTVNQYENESCLTYKHRLARLIHETFGSPSWLPSTYNLVTQLAEFVGDYLASEEKRRGEPNLWITKPWNLARGLDISIGRTLPELIRQRDASTPKIAQRYLTRPCLYNGKKFDLRYIVMLRQIEPTVVACVYNMFWIRLANKKFRLDDLDDYERQFTVMNYSNYQMTQLDHKSFIYHMEKEHSITWSDVQRDINQAIKGVLVAAGSQPQPLGLVPSKKPEYDAFSLYGFDVMLTDDFKPVILEVNFSPDCTRACEYDKQFVNNIFSVLDSRFDQVDSGLAAFSPI